MRPTQVLPEPYSHCYTLDSKQHKITQGVLILLGAGVFLLGWQVLKFIAPESLDAMKIKRGSFHLIIFLATILTMIVLHEGVHGLVLWVFTRKLPSFGIDFMGSIYVNASGWYLPCSQMLIMSLSPFLLLSLVGVILLRFTSGEFFQMTLWAMLLNAAGAINDLAVAGWLFFQPGTALIENNGQALAIYRINTAPHKIGAKEKIRVLVERYLVKLP
jgi:hypothetical protein